LLNSHLYGTCINLNKGEAGQSLPKAVTYSNPSDIRYTGLMHFSLSSTLLDGLTVHRIQSWLVTVQNRVRFCLMSASKWLLQSHF